MTTHSTITVVQVGSAIGRPADQRATLKGLGLNKIGRTRARCTTRPPIAA